jgi:hypothetical protein
MRSMVRFGVAFLICTLPVAPLLGAAQTSGQQSTRGSATDFDVLTQHEDSQRTGAQLAETILSPDTVLSDRFGRLFQWDWGKRREEPSGM